jgi:hypothetical protein
MDTGFKFICIRPVPNFMNVEQPYLSLHHT